MLSLVLHSITCGVLVIKNKLFPNKFVLVFFEVILLEYYQNPVHYCFFFINAICLVAGCKNNPCGCHY